jgi:hypothetical protein
MVVESKRRPAPPPLPAPTDTNSTVTTGDPSDATSEVSKTGDEKSSYSLPDDGTPVTIKTGHRSNASRTSLLIEYFEGGRVSNATGTDYRKPSVRVRVTPGSRHRSKSSSDRDRIKITHSKSRKSSPNRRSSSRVREEDLDDMDASSYASATEEPDAAVQQAL